MNCTTDACNQGRKPCPTPEQCHRAPMGHRDLAILAGFIIAPWCVIAILLWLVWKML